MAHQPELFQIKKMTPFEMDTVGPLPPLAACFDKGRLLLWVEPDETGEKMHLIKMIVHMEGRSLLRNNNTLIIHTSTCVTFWVALFS